MLHLLVGGLGGRAESTVLVQFPAEGKQLAV